MCAGSRGSRSCGTVGASLFARSKQTLRPLLDESSSWSRLSASAKGCAMRSNSSTTAAKDHGQTLVRESVRVRQVFTACGERWRPHSMHTEGRQRQSEKERERDTNTHQETKKEDAWKDERDRQRKRQRKSKRESETELKRKRERERKREEEKVRE